jgi:undecaprenyl-diphosphatase
MINYLQGIDIKVLDMLNKKFRYAFLDKIMPIITALGNGGLIWIMISIYMINMGNYTTEGYMIFTSLAVTTIIGEGIIKHLIKRARPFVNLIENKLLISKPLSYSFPSGHTASSFAVTGVFFTINNNWSILVLILASLIAFSRIYLNVHYPTDVVTGIILGLLCSKLVITIFQHQGTNILNFYHKYLL